MQEEAMKLRDHPLMSYKGIRTWPPSWLWTGGYESTFPEGEVGILKDVQPSTISSHNSCFLIMEHCGAQYIGALLLGDRTFYLQTYALLVHNCGKMIQDIGEIEISQALDEQATTKGWPPKDKVNFESRAKHHR
jgi:hypothetical protein